MTSYRSTRLWVWLAVAGIVVGAGLRTVHLGRWTLWCDELASLRRATTLSFGDHLAAMRGNHPLYEVAALRPWTRLTTSDAGLRWPSAVAGTLTLLVVWLIARGMGPAAGAAAVWLLALSPLHVLFSRLARPYALATLWGALAMGFCVLALRRRRWAFLGYGVTSALLVLTNLFAGALTVGQAAFVAWTRRRRLRRLGPWILSGVLCLALVSPWLIANFLAAAKWSQQTPYAAQQLGTPLKALYLPFTFALGETVHPLRLWVVLPAAVGFSLATVAGVCAAWRRRLPRFMLLQLVAVFGAGLAFRAAAPKHLLVAAPAFAMLLAAGLVALRPVWLRWVAVVLIFGAQVVSLTNYFAGRDFHDADMVTPWRRIVKTVVANEKPGQALLIGYRSDPDTWRMFRRYYAPAGGKLDPVWLGRPVWRAKILRSVDRSAGVWLLLHEGDDREILEQWLKSRGLIEREWGFQLEEHTLRGLREGLGSAGRHRSFLYKLYLLRSHRRG